MCVCVWVFMLRSISAEQWCWFAVAVFWINDRVFSNAPRGFFSRISGGLGTRFCSCSWYSCSATLRMKGCQCAGAYIFFNVKEFINYTLTYTHNLSKILFYIIWTHISFKLNKWSNLLWLQITIACMFLKLCILIYIDFKMMCWVFKNRQFILRINTMLVIGVGLGNNLLNMYL